MQETPGAHLGLRGWPRPRTAGCTSRRCARVGAQTRDLAGQIDAGPLRCSRDVAVILIGANDVTHAPAAVGVGAAALPRACVGSAPRASRSSSAPVPTSARSSRSRRRCARWPGSGPARLAAAQAIAVVEAGGRTVSLGSILGPGVRGHPEAAVRPRPVPPVGGRLLEPGARCCCPRSWPPSGVIPRGGRCCPRRPGARPCCRSRRPPSRPRTGARHRDRRHRGGGSTRGARGRWVADPPPSPAACGRRRGAGSAARRRTLPSETAAGRRLAGGLSRRAHVPRAPSTCPTAEGSRPRASRKAESGALGLWPARRCGAAVAVVAAQDRQDPEQLDVDPDDRDGQAEGGAPRLTLGQPGCDAPLDEVEVEDQHAGRPARGRRSSSRRPSPPKSLIPNVGAEEPEHEVEQRDGRRSRRSPRSTTCGTWRLTLMLKNLYAASVPATAAKVPTTAPRSTRPGGSPNWASIALLKAPTKTPSTAA